MTQLLKEQFSLHDKFSCGVIPKSQFADTLSRFGLENKGIERIASKFQNGTSDVDYRAFLNYYAQRNNSGAKKVANSTGKRQYEQKTRHLSGNGTALGASMADKNAHSPGSEWRYNVQQEVVPRSELALQQARMLRSAQQKPVMQPYPEPSPAEPQQQHPTATHADSTTTKKRKSPVRADPKQQLHFVPPPQNNSKTRRVENELVGHHHLNATSKLFKLRDKVAQNLLQTDASRSGFVSAQQFKSALKQAGLKETKSLKTLTKAFTDPQSQNQVDYHHFLSLINPNSQLVEDAIGTGIAHEPLITRNNGEGVAGKKKHFENQRLDSMEKMLKMEGNSALPAQHSTSEWLPTVAHQASGIYSQIFDKFFTHDPVFTGYVDQKSFEKVIRDLNIAPQNKIPTIVRDITDNSSGRVDYNKFMQAIIEERRGHAPARPPTKLIKDYDPKGSQGVKMVADRYQEQLSQSHVLNNERPLSDAEKGSISGVRKKAIPPRDQIADIFNHENEVSENTAKKTLNRTNSSKIPSQEDIIMQKIRSKVHQHNASISSVFRAYADNGVIEYPEFKHALDHYCGLPLSDEQLKPIFDRFDVNRTGEIAYSDFARQLTSHTPNLSSDVFGLGDARDPVKKEGRKSSKYAFASSSDNTVTDVPATTKFDREMHKLRRHISEKASIKSTTVQDLFRSLDTNHDGILSHGELRRGLDSIGVPLTDQQFEQIIKVSDNANSGHVDFDRFASLISGKPNDEFVFHSLIDKSFYDRPRGLRYIEEPLSKDQKLVANQKRKFVNSTQVPSDSAETGLPKVAREDRQLFDKLQERLYGRGERLQDLFRRMDGKKEGRITREQFKRSLQKEGVSLSMDEYEKLFSHIDRSRDNSIDYREFAAFMSEDMTGIENNAGKSQHHKSQQGTLSANTVGRVLKSKTPQLNQFIEQLDNKGSVSYDDFSSFLKNDLQLQVESGELNKLLHHMDPDRAGTIRFSNFMQFVNHEDVSQLQAIRSNMDTGAIGMSTVDEKIIGSTPENPYFRGAKRPNGVLDVTVNTINVVGTPKHLQDELDAIAESERKAEKHRRYEVSDHPEDAPGHSVIEQSQMVSPPKTPKPQSKILRHTEPPLKHSEGHQNDEGEWQPTRHDAQIEERIHDDIATSQNPPPTKPRLIELQTVTGRPVSFNQFNRLCRAFDDKGEGKISQQAFHTALNRMGIDPESQELKQIARACTKNNEIDYKKVQFVFAGLSPVPTPPAQKRAPQKSPLAQALREEISEKFNQRAKNLTQAFLSADVNRTGALEPDELKQTLHKFEVNLSDDKIHTIAREFGDDQGRITLQKFIEFVKPRSFWENQAEQKRDLSQNDFQQYHPLTRSPDAVLQKVQNKLEEKSTNRKDAFLALDQKKEGKIRASDLGASLERMGIVLNERELKRLVSKFDQDKDGMVDFADFSQTFDSQQRATEHRHSTPQERQTVALTNNIRKELLEGTQNKLFKIHEAFKALDYTKERRLDPARFRQAITAAAESLPDWIVDRSVRMAQTVDGTCDYEHFLKQLGVDVPEYKQHKFKVPSPKIPTRHQHHHLTTDLLSSSPEVSGPSIQERTISPRRGIFHPVDSGDIIAHRGPVRENTQLFQKKTELSRQLFPRDAGPIITKRPYELDLNERMNLSPRQVRVGRYANSPFSRGNPLAYVEFGQEAPSFVFKDDARHPDDMRRKKVIERAPSAQEVKLLHHSKGRAAPNHPVKPERSELKHTGFEKNKQDSVERLFKDEQLEEKPHGIRTSYSHSEKVKESLRSSPEPAPAEVQNVRLIVQNLLENKFGGSNSVAFKHLLGEQGGNKLTIQSLQQELSKRANLHLSKNDLRKAIFDKGDALEYSDFVVRMQGERAASAPPTRPSPAHTFMRGVPNRGVNRKNYSRDIISFRY